jgi:hypothetical protein
MTKLIIIFATLLLCFQYSATVSAQSAPEKEKLTATGELFKLDNLRKYRIIKQPNGPFAAIIFDEDALAVHLCVIYYDHMGGPWNERWDITDRAWCNRKWGADITGFYWSPNGKYLYIGTSLIYGDGGLFRLDLYNKKFIKIYPPANLTPPKESGQKYVSATEIVGATQNRLKLKVRITETIDSKEQDIEKIFVLPIKE